MKRKKNKRKKYRKQNTYKFLYKIYKLFKTNPEIFVLKKISFEGEYDPVDDIIFIDYRKEIFSTICHEILHYFHPTWSETKVILEEHRIMNNISLLQMKHFIKRFSSIL